MVNKDNISTTSEVSIKNLPFCSYGSERDEIDGWTASIVNAAHYYNNNCINNNNNNNNSLARHATYYTVGGGC